jgi:hypothetical protein
MCVLVEYANKVSGRITSIGGDGAGGILDTKWHLPVARVIELIGSGEYLFTPSRRVVRRLLSP